MREKKQLAQLQSVAALKGSGSEDDRVTVVVGREGIVGSYIPVRAPSS